MCSNEDLQVKINSMQSELKEFKDESKERHKYIWSNLDEIKDSITKLLVKSENFITKDDANDRFVMRREFTIAITIVWAIATLLWLVSLFVK